MSALIITQQLPKAGRAAAPPLLPAVSLSALSDFLRSSIDETSE